MCLKSYDSAKTLKNHNNRQHHYVGSPQCTICLKKYSTIYNLANHMKLHTDKKSPSAFPCTVCGTNYVSKHDLKRHLEAHHNLNIIYFKINEHLNKIYECSMCNKKYTSYHNFKDHVITHINGKHKCKLCSAVYSYKSGLYRHKRIKHTNADTNAVTDTDAVTVADTDMEMPNCP